MATGEKVNEEGIIRKKRRIRWQADRQGQGQGQGHGFHAA